MGYGGGLRPGDEEEAPELASFIAKLDAEGELVWFEKLEDQSGIADLAVSEDGTSFVSSDRLLRRFDEDGHVLWTEDLSSQGLGILFGDADGVPHFSTLAATRDGKMLVAVGDFRSDLPGISSSMLVKVDGEGGLVGALGIDLPLSFDALALTSDGAITYATGGDEFWPFVAAITDEDSLWFWSPEEPGMGTDLAVSPSGDLFVSGLFWEGPDPAGEPSASDWFFARIDPESGELK